MMETPFFWFGHDAHQVRRDEETREQEVLEKPAIIAAKIAAHCPVLDDTLEEG